MFAGKVETVAYHGAEPGKNADELVEKAIQDGADIVPVKKARQESHIVEIELEQVFADRLC